MAKLGRRTPERKNPQPESIADLRKEWDSRLTAEERLAALVRVAAVARFEESDAVAHRSFYFR